MLECISRRSSPEYLLQAKIECVFQSVQYNVSPNSVKAKGCGREPLTTACLIEYRKENVHSNAIHATVLLAHSFCEKKFYSVSTVNQNFLLTENKYSAPTLGNDMREQYRSPISRLPTDAEMAKRCQLKCLLWSVAISSTLLTLRTREAQCHHAQVGRMPADFMQVRLLPADIRDQAFPASADFKLRQHLIN